MTQRQGRAHAQTTLEYAALIAAVAIGLSGFIVYVQRSVKANLAGVEEEVNDAVQEEFAHGNSVRTVGP